MNKKTQVIIIFSVILFFLVVGTLLYNYIGADYTPGIIAVSGPDKSEIYQTNTAPDFTVLDKDGNSVSLSDHFGKPILINFWATWCGPCLSEMPHFETLFREYGDEVVFLMVNLTDGTADTVDSVKNFVEKNGYSFPVYFDTQKNGARAYSVTSIPITYGIDKNGNVIKRHIGSLRESRLLEIIESIK
ncbi:MAG: peroxiredoxin [Firmicutes bacterium HGW-Firmicutes-21]|nr:MAG: peroxiredoxin [Firmicutes bacterium HGW-Firmicutes-21]